MKALHPDQMVMQDQWSEVAKFRELPAINHERLHAYRQQRLKDELVRHDAALLIMLNPISLRYAINYRCYSLFQTHIPSTYLFFPLEGDLVLHGGYDPLFTGQVRDARYIAYFDGGDIIADEAEKLADDVVRYLAELGTDNRRVAVEYVNPSVTLALQNRGLEVIDGIMLTEAARVIKSEDEIACIHHAIAVAELGITKLEEALRPGVSESQLWALLNYTNIANDGDWHEGRMLASGDRINPWIQEASPRRIESGDLVGFDTDMVGPFGYFADISRTLHCGPAEPTKRQKELYRLAIEEIDYNLKLVRPGITLREFQRQAWPTPEEYQQNAYTCVIHGVGMCDEYPQIKHMHRMITPYDGTLEAGMVICVESYMGAVGERDGVKLEQQVLITEDGYEMMTTYPYCERLLG